VAAEKEKAKKGTFQTALASYNQAMKAFHKGDYPKAKELLEQFIEKFSSEREFVDRAKINLSICMARLEGDEITLKTLDDYYQFGVYRLNQGNYQEALNALRKAREKKPKEGKILYLLANVLCRMGETDECLDHLKEAVKLDKFFGILAQNETDFYELKEDKRFNLITKME
jgi:tetratricopeptide (TPR) repeat protein